MNTFNAFAAYAVTAVAGAAGSVAITVVAILHFSQISDSAMWSVALMVASPAFMAVGVAACITVATVFVGRRERAPDLDDLRRSDLTGIREERYPR